MNAAGSRSRRRGVLWGLGGLLLLVLLALLFAAGAPLPAVRHFYVPSESMEPTLNRNDHFVAWMRAPDPLKRGQIILLRNGDATYIQRIAALPGDTIALVDGRVVLNGTAVPQQRAGTVPVADPSVFGPTAVRLREHFPGEEGDHFILDSGPSSEDNFGPQKVAPGHVFTLGDNRDNSADGRVPHEEQGVEQLAIADIRGTPLTFTWPWAKFGKPVH
ncbi:MAG TPA: signal peptidase I [Allosphingosinicella sp.]|nr:signal peptidase I [Allosphingosinicella sp.]